MADRISRVGVDKGMLNMCVGEKRKLTLPHHEAYGKDGYPDSIPPYATLVFDVTLTSLKKAAEAKKNTEL